MKLFSQSYFKYGILMSAIIAICLLIMEITGQNQTFDKSPYAFVFTTLAPAVLWYLGIREKKKELKGKMSFKQGFVQSFKMSLVFAITSPFVFLFYYLFVNPSILPHIKDIYQMKQATDATIISIDMAVQFLGAIIGETLYGAIIAFFLRTRTTKST